MPAQRDYLQTFLLMIKGFGGCRSFRWNSNVSGFALKGAISLVVGILNSNLSSHHLRNFWQGVLGPLGPLQVPLENFYQLGPSWSILRFLYFQNSESIRRLPRKQRNWCVDALDHSPSFTVSSYVFLWILTSFLCKFFELPCFHSQFRTTLDGKQNPEHETELYLIGVYNFDFHC